MERKMRRKNWTIYLVIITAILCMTGITVWAWIAGLLRTIHQPALQPVRPAQQEKPTKETVEPVNILLLGCDTQSPSDPGRSDTIILARLDPVRKTITLLSIPRDTRIRIPGHGYGKINATTNTRTYRDGGFPLLVRSIQQLLPGVQIPYYVQADFAGFVRIIDAIGGVTVRVDERMRYRSDRYSFDLEPGVQHLDGHRALLYARYRSDRVGDFGAWAGAEHGRVVRQKRLLQAVITQTRHLRNPLKLPGLLSSLASAVHTNMPSATMLRLGLSLRDTGGKDTKIVSFPGIPRWIGPTSYVEPYAGPLQTKVAPLFGVPAHP